MAGSFWSHLIHSAKQRNLEFTITEKETWRLFLKQKRKCAISGVELQFAQNYMKDHASQTASIDRIDCSKGYIPTNIRWIHKNINIMRNTTPDQQFLEWCRIITEYQSSQGVK